MNKSHNTDKITHLITFYTFYEEAELLFYRRFVIL